MAGKKKRSFKAADIVPEVESSVKKGIVIVVLFAVAIISLLSIFDLAGRFGNVFYRILELVFGWGFWIFPLILIVAGYLSLANTRHYFNSKNWIGMFFMVVGYSGFFHLMQDPESFSETLNKGIGGGYIGFAIAWPLFKIMGRWAAMVVVIAVLIIGIMMMFDVTLESLIDKITFKTWRERRREGRDNESGDEEEYDEEEDEGVEFEEKAIADSDSEEEGEQEEKDNEEEYENNEETKEPRAKKTKKHYPRIDIPLDILDNKKGRPTARDVDASQRIIKKTLKNFGIDVEMGEVAVGPTVTQYTFRPADGVKLSRIVGLGNDMALALAAHPIRIEAPIPGKSLVGIEVPNQKIAIVTLREMLETVEFKKRKSNLSIVLGKDVAGKPWLADLDKLPHLLVAGATNSGKTVCLNTIIISLLYQNQPNELKLILVDPKRVEMPVYNGIPHLITPVITDVKKTINALKWTISEMERRFYVLSNAGKRNIQSYNATYKNDKLPYIVFIIDELADLMSTASAEVEAAVIRLAQMARAVGIHLILATQRPSVDIITGLIKANIPGRIAFSVASLTDSRTILDVSGAEKLLGRGDMLYSSAETSKPRRIQGAFSSDKDIESVVEYLRERTEPDYEEGVTEKTDRMGLGGVVFKDRSDEDADELLGEARELIINEGKASASFLQRRLKIGYARAARILDLLEERGVIGPVNGAKPRDILVKKGEDSLVEKADSILANSVNLTRVATPVSLIEDNDIGDVEEIKEEEVGENKVSKDDEAKDDDEDSREAKNIENIKEGAKEEEEVEELEEKNDDKKEKGVEEEREDGEEDIEDIDEEEDKYRF